MTCSLQGKLQTTGAHLLLARTVAVTACGQELARRTEVRAAVLPAGRPVLPLSDPHSFLTAQLINHAFESAHKKKRTNVSALRVLLITKRNETKRNLLATLCSFQLSFATFIPRTWLLKSAIRYSTWFGHNEASFNKQV